MQCIPEDREIRVADTFDAFAPEKRLDPASMNSLPF